jgi:hypothetical protein
MSNTSMPIGALAREWDVKVPTIRFYESIGLLPKAPRTESGRRFYGETASSATRVHPACPRSWLQRRRSAFVA